MSKKGDQTLVRAEMAPGVYLIQVFDPSRRDFYRYVGMARRSLRDRWTTYAETGGTAGSEEAADDGNKYLSRLCGQMGSEKFTVNWRIQVIRLADTNEVRSTILCNCLIACFFIASISFDHVTTCSMTHGDNRFKPKPQMFYAVSRVSSHRAVW